MASKQKIALSLHRIGAIKFGSFTLKSGMKSPFYIDLRLLVSYPEVLKEIASALLNLSKANKLRFDRIAGIPYAALPIATAFSLLSKKPMIYSRKEAKEYGTKKQVEGEFRKGETVLVIDDLITTGQSKFEAIQPLLENGLKVKDIAVLIDREQGGIQELKAKGLNLHSVLPISELAEILFKKKKISKGQYSEIISFIRQ